MTCRACGRANPDDARFCGGCGARLELVCAACQAPNPGANRFCHRCGAPLDAAVESSPSPRSYTPKHLADKILIPGVLDSTTNFIEHPELVAQRIVRYAEVVGRERVIAGSDCGFGTFARSNPQVEPEIVWAKLAAMAEGARLATAILWR